MSKNISLIILMFTSIVINGQSPESRDHKIIESHNDSMDLASNHYQLYDSTETPAYDLYRSWDNHNMKYLSGGSIIEKADYYLSLDSMLILLTDSIRDYSMPVSKDRITSHFGMRYYRYHYGTDIDLDTGDSILTVFDGQVRYTDYYHGYGNVVVIRHYNGLETVYAHLSDIIVDTNDFVSAGDLIGYGGNTGRSTGSHLHFEMRYRGAAFDSRAVFDYDSFRLEKDTFWLCATHFAYLGPVRNLKYARYHYVRKGDYLGKIARMYDTGIGRLCRLNGISRRTILQIGQKLRVR
ncbi:MAG: peptidoglycan DD-metalloendopeptidase family protein [Bacteroidales bacterium]|nr:peptidoglycan DD-metalloendopeptidase family protein [Bacteroidales bacterium]